MGFLRKNWKYYVINIFLAVGVYYASRIYDLTNKSTGIVHILQTSFDRLVPFIPQFIVIYNTLEPVLYASLLFFFIFHPKIFTAFASAMIALFLVSNAVYVLFQTKVPRPVLSQDTNWYVNKVIELYKSDNPYNCFPSLHCGTSTLAASFWFVKKRYRIIAFLMAIWAVLIILSTQFLKQHVVVDITGSIIALLLYFAAFRIFRLEKES
jgi:membrane-associated phospholipid phosphatase